MTTNPFSAPLPTHYDREPSPIYDELFVERTLADLFGPLRREVGEA